MANTNKHPFQHIIESGQYRFIGTNQSTSNIICDNCHTSNLMASISVNFSNTQEDLCLSCVQRILNQNMKISYQSINKPSVEDVCATRMQMSFSSHHHPPQKRTKQQSSKQQSTSHTIEEYQNSNWRSSKGHCNIER
jgi:hypothetical protein